MQLKWKLEVVARAAEYFRQFERYTALLRYQGVVLANNEVADYEQACGSVVLVVRAAAEHEKNRNKN